MVLVDCPWCEEPVELDEDATAVLRCTACLVVVELARERVSLPAAVAA
jgi:hypothetical protein